MKKVWKIETSPDKSTWTDRSKEIKSWECALATSIANDFLTLDIQNKEGDNTTIFTKDLWVRLTEDGTVSFVGQIKVIEKALTSGGYTLDCTVTELSSTFKKFIIFEKEYTDTELSDIIKDLISYFNTRTGHSITVTNVATTNITVSQFFINEQSLFDIFSKLGEMAAFDWFLDKDQDFNFFRRRSKSGQSFTDGDNIVHAEFEEDIESIINRVIVRGGAAKKGVMDLELNAGTPDTCTINSEWASSKKANVGIIGKATKMLRIFPDSISSPNKDLKIRLEKCDANLPSNDDDMLIVEKTITPTEFQTAMGQADIVAITPANWTPSNAGIEMYTNNGSPSKIVIGSFHDDFELTDAERSSAGKPLKWTIYSSYYKPKTTDEYKIEDTKSGCGPGGDDYVYCYAPCSPEPDKGFGKLLFYIGRKDKGGVPRPSHVWLANSTDTLRAGVKWDMNGKIYRYYFDGGGAVQQDTGITIPDGEFCRVLIHVDDVRFWIYIDRVDKSFTDGKQSLFDKSDADRVYLQGYRYTGGVGTANAQCFVDNLIWYEAKMGWEERYLYNETIAISDLSKMGIMQYDFGATKSPSGEGLDNMVGLRLTCHGKFWRDSYIPIPTEAMPKMFLFDINPFLRDKIEKVNILCPYYGPYSFTLEKLNAQRELLIPLAVDGLKDDEKYNLSIGVSTVMTGWYKINGYKNTILENWTRDADNEWTKEDDYFCYVDPLVPIPCVMDVRDPESELEHGLMEMQFEDVLLSDEFDAKLLAIKKLQSLKIPKIIGELCSLDLKYSDRGTLAEVYIPKIDIKDGSDPMKFRVSQVVTAYSTAGYSARAKLIQFREEEETDLISQLKIVLDKSKSKEQKSSMPDIRHFYYWFLEDFEAIDDLAVVGAAVLSQEQLHPKYGSYELKAVVPSGSGWDGFKKEYANPQDWSDYIFIELWIYSPTGTHNYKFRFGDGTNSDEFAFSNALSGKWEKFLIGITVPTPSSNMENIEWFELTIEKEGTEKIYYFDQFMGLRVLADLFDLPKELSP